jgi:hypothetical protein
VPYYNGMYVYKTQIFYWWEIFYPITEHTKFVFFLFYFKMGLSPQFHQKKFKSNCKRKSFENLTGFEIICISMTLHEAITASNFSVKFLSKIGIAKQ